MDVSSRSVFSRQFRSKLVGGAFFVLFAAVSGSVKGADSIDFNRDIRPLLGKHCTACHGGVKAAGGISFVYRNKAVAKGKSGEVAIVAGKPDESELIKRVLSDDPEEVMPKPEHGPKLTAAEVAKLKAWIAQGADWSEHWSFVPPREATPPNLKTKEWAKSRMDEWVLAKIEAAGEKPSKDASPKEWLRRVTLDLIGLPPSLEDWERFRVAYGVDASKAKAAEVDRLLAMPAFGERWASVWLDLARYADSFGFEKDPHRDIWPWRDWVIRAFNGDMPFDQFTIRQLAGDLIPNPTLDDLLATAFHRNTPNNTEGGTDDEEFRVLAVLDRVNTTWTAWQATTFGCVQCHSHPYDPFPHKDYYRFAAFFNNTEDNDLDDDFPRLTIPNNEAEKADAASLWLELRTKREEKNTAGLKVVKEMKDPWKKWVPITGKAAEGILAIGSEGRVDVSGTIPVRDQYTSVSYTHLTLPTILLV